MEGQKQLLSEEVPKNSECAGIEAPELIQQDITADEEDTTQDNLKLSDVQVVSNNEVSSTERKECEETQDREIEVRVELRENKREGETSPNDGENKTTENNDKDAVGNGGNDTNVQTSSEMNSNEKDDSEKTQNTTEEIANDKEEENIDTKTEETANNGNHCAEVVADDGNNNVENTESGTKTKDSVRRTRFSSEITIQPKAYFQAGAETVVMMPPGSSADDVFKNDSRSTSTASSAHAVGNAHPSDSVLPRTFLPLTLFTCLFCPMIGLFAVYKSYSVKQFIKKGDIRKANQASQHARQLGVLTLCIGFFFVLAIVVIAVLVSTLT
ncbi:hypothetical protein BRAFLDRAFT_203123 [Paramuricea clavata]|nr:hypothetical protein BRAFLDRAFT_203123 [Paramuricea clavata]